MDQFDVIRQSVDVAVRVIANARADCWATAVAAGASYPAGGDPWLGHAVEQLCVQAAHAPDLGDPSRVAIPEFDGKIDREGIDALTARLVELRALIPPAALGMVVSTPRPSLRFPTSPTADDSPATAEPGVRRRAPAFGAIAGVVIALVAGVGVITAVSQSSDDQGASSSLESSAVSTNVGTEGPAATISTDDPATSTPSVIATTTAPEVTASATTTTDVTTTVTTTTVVDTTIAALPEAPATTARTPPTPPATAAPVATAPTTTVPRTTTTTAAPTGPDLTQLPYFWALATFSVPGADAMVATSVDRSPAWAYGQHLRLGFEADPKVVAARTSLRRRTDGGLDWCITGTCRVLRDIVVTGDGLVETFTVDGSPLARDVRSWAGDGPLLCPTGPAPCTDPTSIALRIGSVFSVGGSTFVDLEVTVGPNAPGGVRLGGIQALVDATARPSRAIVAPLAPPGARTVWLVRFDRFDALAPLQLDLSVAVNDVPAQWQLVDR